MVPFKNGSPSNLVVLNECDVLKAQNDFMFFLSRMPLKRWFAFKTQKELYNLLPTLLKEEKEFFLCECASKPHRLTKHVYKNDSHDSYNGPQHFVDRHLRQFGWTLYAPCRYDCKLKNFVTLTDQSESLVVRYCHSRLSSLSACLAKNRTIYEVINRQSKLYIRVAGSAKNISQSNRTNEHNNLADDNRCETFEHQGQNGQEQIVGVSQSNQETNALMTESESVRSKKKQILIDKSKPIESEARKVFGNTFKTVQGDLYEHKGNVEKSPESNLLHMQLKKCRTAHDQQLSSLLVRQKMRVNELKMEMDMKLQRLYNENKRKLQLDQMSWISEEEHPNVRLQLCKQIIYKQQLEQIKQTSDGFNLRLKKLLDDNLVELQSCRKQHEMTVNAIYEQHFTNMN